MSSAVSFVAGQQGPFIDKSLFLFQDVIFPRSCNAARTNVPPFKTFVALLSSSFVLLGSGNELRAAE